MAEAQPSYPLATDEDFDKFVKNCDTTENWNVCLDQEDLKVWDQKSDTSAINIVKLYAVFSDVPALVLYDVLHDPEYRAVWDENMIEGYNIQQLDRYNDIGYYSAKAPSPVANRDFVNQRMWRVKDEKEYIIMNHSVVHPKAPEKKGFVRYGDAGNEGSHRFRAQSIMTGYLVRVRDAGGCTLTYLTQSDPKGWIPAWLSNKVTKTFAPRIIEKLVNAARNYEAWKKDHNPEKRPWRIFND